MLYYEVPESNAFIGRSKEVKRLQEFVMLPHSAIMVIYGRRRISKTELIEQTFKNRHLLKFEGLENQPQQDQIQQVLYQMAKVINRLFFACNPHFFKTRDDPVGKVRSKGGEFDLLTGAV